MSHIYIRCRLVRKNVNTIDGSECVGSKKNIFVWNSKATHVRVVDDFFELI